MAWSYQLKCCQSHLICWIFKEKPENLSPKHQKSDTQHWYDQYWSMFQLYGTPTNINWFTDFKKAQRQASRFATDNYSSRDPESVTNMIQQLGWEPLEHRRAWNCVITCMFYKIYIPSHCWSSGPQSTVLQFTNSRTCGGPWQITLFCHIRTDV